MMPMSVRCLTKYLPVIVILFLLSVAEARGRASEEAALLYNRANQHYIRKEYRKARVLYQELVDRGIENSSLYYNLANTHYKLGEKGQAVLFYERALRLRPLDREIRSNLRFVQKSLEDQITPLYNERFTRSAVTILSIFTANTLAYIELALFIITVGFFIGAVLFPALRNRLRNACMVSSVFLLLSLSGLLARRYQQHSHPRAVILAEQIDIRSSPIAESEVLFTLHDGTRVRIIERRGEWVRFQIADGREGWLLMKDLELIEPEVLL